MSKVRIGLFGFGKAGKSVALEILKDENFKLEWVAKKTLNNSHKYASRFVGLETDEGLIYSIDEMTDDFFEKNPVEIIVDFSDSKGVHYYQKAAKHGIKIISAISKYMPDDLLKLESLAADTSVLYSPNITLGINVLLVASKVLQSIAPHSDIEIVEEHFKGKKEVSGTAIKIADSLHIEHEHINSIRAGGIVGRHEIIFGLPNQTIRLSHESISRAAFGQGAIFAAKNIMGKDNGLFTMDQIVSEMFKQNLPVF